MEKAIGYMIMVGELCERIRLPKAKVSEQFIAVIVGFYLFMFGQMPDVKSQVLQSDTFVSRKGDTLIYQYKPDSTGIMWRVTECMEVRKILIQSNGKRTERIAKLREECWCERPKGFKRLDDE